MSDEIVGAARLVAPGGFARPEYPPTFTITYRVQNPLRRAWHRLTGWSTEWVVEYDWVEPTPVWRDLPRFTAARGGISFDE